MEQVSTCRWDRCGKDLGNMDALVQHIYAEHIGSAKATYACMWGNCSEKGMPQASGYALRAHMGSHTKEKLFYCSLLFSLFLFPFFGFVSCYLRGGRIMFSAE
jgi:hypothetical protein